MLLLLRGMGSRRRLARRVGVSHAAVRKWLRPGDAHPSNINLRKIIELAVEFDGTTASKILRRDLRAHKTSFERFRAALEW